MQFDKDGAALFRKRGVSRSDRITNIHAFGVIPIFIRENTIEYKKLFATTMAVSREKLFGGVAHNARSARNFRSVTV